MLGSESGLSLIESWSIQACMNQAIACAILDQSGSLSSINRFIDLSVGKCHFWTKNHQVKSKFSFFFLFFFFFFFHSFICGHDSLVSRLPLMFHFLCFHCSSMVPASRNPMWGEEFNFFVDELPVQVDILCSYFIYTSSCDHLHWNIGESLWKSCARWYCKMILACCNLKCFKGICLHLVCQFTLRRLFLLILYFNINDLSICS